MQESALFSQAAEDFQRKLNDPGTSGAVFFAVCRQAACTPSIHAGLTSDGRFFCGMKMYGWVADITCLATAEAR